MLVAVDGGQSALRLAAGPADVRTPAPTSAPGFAWNGADPVTTIAGGVAAAWRAIPEQSQGRSGQVSRVVLGLTGLPEDPGDQERLASTIIDLLGAEEVWLCRDMVTAHAGALPERDGVVLTVGTGVACLGVVREPAELFHADGWGYLLGDTGGAFWIGQAGLRAVLRAYDGRGQTTTLTGRAVARYGPEPGMPFRIYRSDTHVDDIARFAQDVCTEAEAGDETALGIVGVAAAELAATAVPIAERYVASAGRSAPVAVAGRVVTGGSVLHRLFVREIRSRSPRTRVATPAGTSLDGAWTLAVTTDPDPYPVTRFRRP